MPTSNFTVSRSRIAPSLAKSEVTYGTDPTPACGSDEFFTYDSAIKAVPRSERFEFRPHGASFTRQNDIIGARWVDLTFKSLLQTSGTNNDATVRGFKGLNAATKCCGVNQSTSGGFLTWAPASIANLTSTTFWVEHHGYVHKVTGGVGNVVMTGTSKGGVELDYSILGLYVVPLTEGSIMNSWDPGTSRARPFLGATCSINNGGALTPVLSSFRFDLGVQTERIDNALDASGTESTIIIDRNPTLELVLAADMYTSANITYAGWFTDWFTSGSTTHAITMTYGSTTNKVAFSFPTAEVVEVTPQTNGGHNEVRILYKLQHVTAESEWLITFGA